MSKEKSHKRMLSIKVDDAWIDEFDAWRKSQAFSPTKSDIIRTLVTQYVRGELVLADRKAPRQPRTVPGVEQAK